MLILLKYILPSICALCMMGSLYVLRSGQDLNDAVLMSEKAYRTTFERESFYESRGQTEELPHNWLYRYVDRIVVATLPERRDHVEHMLDFLNIDAILFDVYTDQDLANVTLSTTEQAYVTKLSSNSNGIRKLALVKTKRDIYKHALNVSADRLLFFEDDINLELLSPTSLRQQIEHLWSALPPRWNVFNLGRCLAYCDYQKPLGHGLVQDLANLCAQSIIFDRVALTQLVDAFDNHLLPMGDDLLLAHLTSRGALVSVASEEPLFLQDRSHIGSTLHSEGTKDAVNAPMVCANSVHIKGFKQRYGLTVERFHMADPTNLNETVPDLSTILVAQE
ncbi:uncharacterized protein MONBRDRAFT_8158 [Monosiga brevicollis MX1]|uniref:Uncharacterized protein n=1 Tax=Monosiga brevicollis TaxID=81824 RepID=A9UZ75_MONBE|nr:uncharacterized protein MONBRDRAFT_8158 [Monosiga brevicollis MX1]EDQ89317.1 predicted protein [Monosiga brevicollis MX1]|eukprot:XP_001745893.1 hypothetical protein [Monosiga brevicollis MX1]